LIQQSLESGGVAVLGRKYEGGSAVGSSRLQVGSFAEQNFHDAGVPGGSRTDQHRPIIPGFGVEVSALLKQDTGRFSVTAIRRNHQSRLAILGCSIRIRAFGQQSFHGIGAARGRGLDQF